MLWGMFQLQLCSVRLSGVHSWRDTVSSQHGHAFLSHTGHLGLIGLSCHVRPHIGVNMPHEQTGKTDRTISRPVIGPLGSFSRTYWLKSAVLPILMRQWICVKPSHLAQAARISFVTSHWLTIAVLSPARPRPTRRGYKQCTFNLMCRLAISKHLSTQLLPTSSYHVKWMNN